MTNMEMWQLYIEQREVLGRKIRTNFYIYAPIYYINTYLIPGKS